MQGGRGEGIYLSVRVELKTYGGRRRDTGVTAYALLPGGLLVQFQDGRGYLYDESQPGPKHLAMMVELAERGRGLSTYISRHVGDVYAGRFSREEMQRLSAAAD